MGYTCSVCDLVVHGNASSLVWHFKNRHALLAGRMFTRPVACGQDGCLQTFRYSTALKRHVERNHDILEFGDVNVNVAHPVIDIIQDVPGEDPEAIPPNVDGGNEHVLAKEDVTKLAASTLAKLKASSSVVQSTVDHVVSETSSLFFDVINTLQFKTAELLQGLGIHEDDDRRKTLMDLFAEHQYPYEHLETAHQQHQYFVQSGYFIKPREIPFAVAYYPRNNAQTGHVVQVAKHVTFQYIPLHDLLKCVLESKGFMRTVCHYQPSNDGVMRDFHDGKFCKDNEFFSNQLNIKLLLYTDECEITNPLGSKAGLHKIGVIYCTILNLPPQFRSSLCNCFLVALYNAGDVKTYGFDPILQPLVNDLQMLERDGLQITTDAFEGIVHISVAQVAGDNLGMNGICGFVESFVSNHYCRHCRMHRNDMQNASVSKPELLRNFNNYNEDVRRNDPASTGVKIPCLLNDLAHFHVTTNYAPDLMHDLLEGICGLEVHLVLGNLLQDGFFDLDLLNSRITSFDYAPFDSKNKPSPISRNKVQNPDRPSGQTASQMWCLIRYLPLMIGDKVPEGNTHLELILILLECMDFIFCPEVTVDETLFLKHLIQDHHNHFLNLYPDRNLKPKHHFMTHYPQQMQLLGPLINYWTMRFEAKHRFFKRLGHIICNYRNILKTLSERQQMFLCYNMISGVDLVHKDVEVGPGCSTILVSLDRAEFLSRELGMHMFEEVFIAKWSIVHGVKYCKNLLVVTGKCDQEEPIFQQIIYVICIDNGVKLVTESWDTVKYDRHTHTYALQQIAEPAWSVISVNNLYDRQPYHAAKSYQATELCYVTLRHRIP
ncbi:uncharacterized protein [Apostichopus japonicus]|uniref:uncharacterized protein isoform X1 n=1 Tax=Stichopus japonicus TaxID=307972 RepID=UPI003AB68C49